MNLLEVTTGDGPLVLAQPHGGTYVPEDLYSRLNERGRGLDDTDWHITRLYHGLLAGITLVRSNVHRYVIDANRGPDGTSLYPGQNTTALCPLTDFDGEAIWQTGQEPSDDEIMARREAYHAPYHQALTEQVARVKQKYGVVILYDCHSIRSELPFLFKGLLPVFNIGTNNGLTCHPGVETLVETICAAAKNYDSVVNARFKGGWTVRHHGRPDNGVHAIQMELAQRAYMREAAPWDYLPDRAKSLRPVLATIVKKLDQLARSGKLAP